MSKHNPNQDYYKTGGRSQTEGPDRMHVNADPGRQQAGENQPQKNSEHPAVRRAKKK